jgi:hypothetical protein
VIREGCVSVCAGGEWVEKGTESETGEAGGELKDRQVSIVRAAGARFDG